MNKIWLILAIAVFVFVQMGALGFADDTDYSRATLRGITGVKVMIEQLPPEVRKYGVSREQIKADVELKLRYAGIKLLSETEENKKGIKPILHVHPSIIALEDGVYIFNIVVGVMQIVVLGRDPSIVTKTYTWSVSGVGATANINDIRRHIKDWVDIFINAYLSENPK